MALIELKNIVKRFGNSTALKGINLTIEPGEIHALAGENGAGKSTLIKILTGAYQPDEGKIIINGHSHSFIPVKESEALGISAVYQDLKLAPHLSIMENVLMGRLPVKAGRIQWREARQLTREALQRVGSDFDPDAVLADLKTADQEIVALAKAVSRDAKLLILDEPTALLAEDDVQKLFEVLRDLTSKGVTILYISHRLEEIFTICNRVTVMRDGSKIWTKNIEEIDEHILVEAITGKVNTEGTYYQKSNIGKPILSIRSLTKEPYYSDVSFDLHRGEVVGLFGLVGAGKSELLKGIFGEIPIDAGELLVDGIQYTPKHPRWAVKAGIGLVPEDRNTEGVLPSLPIFMNVNVSSYMRAAPSGWITRSRDKRRALQLIKDFNVKYDTLEQDITGLSGGNQQKVVLSKWVGTNADILLFDEPTAGIDVGARRDVFKTSRNLVMQGKAILYSSSYLPEIMEVSDRILVLSRGRITGEFIRTEGYDELQIMRIAYK